MVSSPIRVLYVTSTAQIGGSERRALNLAHYSAPERINASLLALEGEGELKREAEAAGVPIECWTAAHIFKPRLLERMRRYLMEGQFDIVQPFGLRAELLVRGPASRAGCQVVSSICSIDPWRRWHHTALDRATASSVSAWISNSEAGKRASVKREKVPENRVVVVPTGIPDREPAERMTRAEARQALGIGSSEGPVLAVVANIRRAKGFEDLIRAIVPLRNKWPALVCLVAGRDDSGGRIPSRIRKSGLENTVRLLGYVEDAGRVYDAADLAVLPSRWEGMPSALIEAMRGGLPSVATEVGGVSEIIRPGQEGLLVPPSAPVDLAEAIDQALSDESRMRQWGAQARQRYEESFGIDLMVDRTTRVYETLVRGRAAVQPES